MLTLQNQIVWCRRLQSTLGAVMLASAVTFYVFGYRPQTARLRDLEVRTAARQRELEANQQKARDRTRIAAANERLRLELDRFRKPSKRQEFSQLVKDLTLAAQQASLRRFNYKPGVPSRGEMFYELPLSVSFEGDFLSASNFLRATEDMQRLTRVRSLKLKSKDIKNGNVRADLTVNICFALD
jgi:Tfp pilus assembly protein PilO